MSPEEQFELLKNHMHHAVHDGDVARMERVLSASNPLLLMAIRKGAFLQTALKGRVPDMLRRLAELGSPLTMAAGAPLDALNDAIETRRIAAVEVLVKLETNLNRQLESNLKMLPLARACVEDPEYGLPMMHLLVQHGAVIDAVDGFGFTALHHAACVGKTEICLELIRLGADPLIKTKAGKDAFHYASSYSKEGPKTSSMAKHCRQTLRAFYDSHRAHRAIEGVARQDSDRCDPL